MSQQKIARYLAENLENIGLTHLFFVPTVLSHTLAEMDARTGIARVMTHGEKAAAYMADGYARATGKVGVCLAQCIGSSNLAAGLRDAKMAGSPVLALTGGPYGPSRERATYQEVDDALSFAPTTKRSMHLDDMTRLPATLNQLLRVATTGTPGPVHLSLRGHFAECEQELLENPASLDARFSQVPALRSVPDEMSLRAALERLRASKRPVIVAGSGVRSSGADESLRLFAEKWAIPVATGLGAKDVLPAHHALNLGVPGLYSRKNANQALLESDLVFFVGSQTDSQTTFRWQTPPLQTPTIHLDINPENLGRHYPDTLPLCGDARATLEELLKADAWVAREIWLGRVRELAAQWQNDWTPFLNSEASPLRPERLMSELNRHLPSDALVVCDTGHAGMWCATFLELGAEQNFMRASGSMGWGMPAAIGAKLACPQRPVVLFSGDGAFWYHLAELETAARWGANAVFVLNNNTSMNQERDIYADAYGGQLSGKHEELWHFRDVDFVALARTMGCDGARVERPADFAGALNRALESPVPFVLDVRTEIEAMAPLAFNGQERTAVRSTL